MTSREFAIEVVKTLQASGHEALWAGGCVRDQLLGRTPKDYDVATSALPDQVREVFGKKRTLPIGASFGVITVLGPKSADPIEVATFRRDGGYSDGRRPDAVEYTDAREDALRRDFTINGMFFDPINENVIDYVGGEEDLAAKQVRAIGNPHERIEEDKLRMLRGVRFASTFDFLLEPMTLAAIQKHASEIGAVSGERIGAELRRMLASPNRTVAMKLLRESMLLENILPSSQSAFADEDSWNAMINCLSILNESDFATAAAVMLESVVSQNGVEDVVARWKLSNEDKRTIGWICRNWKTIAKADKRLWSEVQPLFLSADFRNGLIATEALSGGITEGITFCRDRLEWSEEKLNPKPFLNGSDLKAAGIEPGPKFKRILDAVRSGQLDGEIENVEQAWAKVGEFSG